tara:strand:- start:2051 stop:3286 length:1236 start_codon:yes stop_codon:yes gene_type:complete
MKRPTIDYVEDMITEAAIAASAASLIRSGSVLIVTRSGILRHSLPVARTIREVAINQDLKAVTPADGICPEFVSWQLQAGAQAILATCAKSGTTVDSVDFDRLKVSPFVLPPQAEQRRIVEKLDALTARTARARADLDRIPALVARYKQTVLAKAFGGELTEGWRGANDIHLTSWRLARVGDLAKEVRYGTAAKCHFSPTETPVLRIPNIANGRIDVTDLKHATFDDKERAKLSLEPGDVLVIRSNGSVSLVGRTAVATEAVAGFLYAGYLIRLRLDRDQVSSDYLQRAFEEPSVRAKIESFAKSTSGVHNINSEQLKSLSIPLPPLAEQTEIVCRVGRAFTEIDRLASEAAAARRLLDRLDQAVLAKAFRGELVPQDPADEPASVLLDRIRTERTAAPKAKRGRKAAVSD